MAKKQKKIISVNAQIDLLINNAKNQLPAEINTNANRALFDTMGEALKTINGSNKKKKIILTKKRAVEAGSLEAKHEDYDAVAEKMREYAKANVDAKAFDIEHEVAELMIEALSEYDALAGEKKIFEEGTEGKGGNLKGEYDLIFVPLLAKAVYENPVEGKLEATPTRVRPPREGDIRGHVGRKEAGRHTYPHDYYVDRGEGELSVEETVERSEKRLRAIESILQEEGLALSLEDAEKLKEKYATDKDKWKEAEYKGAVGKMLVDWRAALEEAKGISQEEIKADEEAARVKARGLTAGIPQVTNLKKAILLAREDGNKFNDVYDGNYTYFETITPEWMGMMKTLTGRIRSRKEEMRFFKELYGAVIYSSVEKLDVKLESIDKIVRWELRLQQIYGELSGDIDGLEYSSLPVTTFIDPDTGQVSVPEVTLEKDGNLLFADELLNVNDARVTGNREMALRSIEDFENLMKEMFRDPATKGLAQRFYIRFYSGWHKEFLGKMVPEGQEYKYYTDTMKKLLSDSQFIAEKQILTRVLSSAELHVINPMGHETTILDNEDVVENFMGLSLETQYELLQLAKKVGGSEGMNPQLLTSIAILVNNLSGHSPAYSPVLVKAIGKQLVTQFSPDQVNVISNYVLGFENVFVQTGQYADLESWYNTLPSRMNEIFTTIRDLMKESREPGRDIRVRMPSEEDWVEVYRPGARFVVQIPKHVYYEWASGVLDGMPDNAAVRAMIAPDLTEGIRGPPSSIITEQRFFEQGIVYAEVLKPYPFIRIPITVENLGVLAPNIIPRIGPWHNFRSRLATAYAYQGEFGKAEDLTSMSIGEEIYFKGLGKEAMQRHMSAISQDTGISQGEVRARHIDDISVGKGNTLWNMDATYRVMHGTEADEEEIAINSLAPKGADTAIYFKHVEDEKGQDRYRAYVYQRLENGVFALVDYEDLEPENAAEMYNNVFRDADGMDVVRKMYAETGVMGTGADETVMGDWRYSLDGCMLFAGNDDEFMVTETTVDENGAVVVDNAAMFQGVGGSLEKYNTGGGFGSYEHTRQGRAVTGGGWVDAKHRQFAIARIFAKNLQKPAPEGAELPGEQPVITGTPEESGPTYTDIELDAWLLKSRKYNFRAFMNTLGIAEGDTKYGTLANYMGKKHYVGGTMRGRHDIGEWSGSAYGMWGREMANALVASTLVQTAGTAEEPHLGDLALGSLFAINSNLDIQGIFAYHQDMEGEVLVPTERTPGAEQLGTVAKLTWDHEENRVGIDRVEVVGAYYQRTEPTEEEPLRGAIAGGALEWEGALPGTAEAYFPGMGELKLTIGDVDVVAGGGRTMFDSYGGHAGARVRVGRLTLFGVTAVEEEGPAGDTSETAERARTMDAMAGFRYFLGRPETLDQWRWQIFGGVSGILQEFEESGTPWQMDTTLGLLGSDAFQRFTVNMGLSHWDYREDWMNRLLLNVRYSTDANLGAVHRFFLNLSVGHEWGPEQGSGSVMFEAGGEFW